MEGWVYPQGLTQLPVKIGMARGKEDELACWHFDENGIKISEISGIICFTGNNC